MSVNFLDRYFASSQVKNPRKSTFLVVALTSLFIAGKIVEEAREPLAPELVSFGNQVWGDGMCTVKQLFLYERKILSKLSFNVTSTTPHAIIDELLFIINQKSTPNSTKLDRIRFFEQTHVHFNSLLTQFPTCLYKSSVLALSTISKLLSRDCPEPLFILNNFDVDDLKRLVGWDERMEGEYNVCVNVLNGDF
jgi:hypothetical protein